MIVNFLSLNKWGIACYYIVFIESPYVYEGMSGKGRFITDFYAAFIFCSTTNSFFGPLVNYDRLVEKTGFRAVGVENFFFPLPPPSFFFEVKMR